MFIWVCCYFLSWWTATPDKSELVFLANADDSLSWIAHHPWITPHSWLNPATLDLSHLEMNWSAVCRRQLMWAQSFLLLVFSVQHLHFTDLSLIIKTLLFSVVNFTQSLMADSIFTLKVPHSLDVNWQASYEFPPIGIN